MNEVKHNPIRIIAGLLSFASLIVLLFCPLISVDFFKEYNFNFFSLLENIGEIGDDGVLVTMLIAFAAFVTLIAALVAIAGQQSGSKAGAISLNIVGLIPILFMIFALYADDKAEYIGMGIYLYIVLTIISIILLGISSTTVVNSKPQNDDNTMVKIEILERYKELLDAGAITKEEYEAKKAQLLNMKDQ